MGHYTVYTAGHGESDWESLSALLRPRGVELIVDVRAWPYLHTAPDFDRVRLERLARGSGMEYVWLGGQLGALTADGRVDYIAKEREPRYGVGIQQLLDFAHDYTVCLLGGAPDPEQCHRHHLIAQTLLRYDVAVRHILPDGADTPAQADLFHVLG